MRQIGRFIVVGGLGFIVDAGVLEGMARLGATAFVGRLVSLPAAIVFTWACNRRLTFEAAAAPTLREFVHYCAISLVSTVINYAGFSVAILLGSPRILAVAIGTIAAAGFNFVRYRALFGGKGAASSTVRSPSTGEGGREPRRTGEAAVQPDEDVVTAMTRPRRILAVASGGGHWIQLQRLRPAFEGCEVTYVSVFPDYADDLRGERFYVVRDVTRMSIGRLFVLVPQLLRIMLREKPDVVITTGSAPGAIALAVAKVSTRARTVWIDSIANCERMSSSGKQARRFADKWLTQWPELAGPEGPEYWGAVL